VTDIVGSVKQAEADGAICVRAPVAATAFDGRRIAFVFFRGIGLIEYVEARHMTGLRVALLSSCTIEVLERPFASALRDRGFPRRSG
jgi:hypothetical protein